MNWNKTLESTLRPGDVLLSCGGSELSLGIRDLDGGSYSHAAVWDGQGLIEATLPCVRRVSLDQATLHTLSLDVFRYTPESAAREDVVIRALQYMGRPYAMLDLAWCTLVVAVSSWMPEDWTEMNALYGVGRLDRLLRTVREAEELRMRAEVTCVELVARAHLEAGLPLKVRLAGSRRFDPLSFGRAVRDIVRLMRARKAQAQSPANELPPPVLHRTEPSQGLESFDVETELAWLGPADAKFGPESKLQELREDWLRHFSASGAEAHTNFELNPTLIRAKELTAGVDWSAALLTPRLLEQSPSLVRLGRLYPG